MKKLLVLLSLILVSGCTSDILEPIDLNQVDVPESLHISAVSGLKLESTIVTEEVRMNVKLPYSGTYRIKIRDISKELISQEKITANQGDNLLKVYVSSLPKDGYTIELTNDIHEVLGLTTLIVN